ncbi:MAG TPA: polysaccharide deacetylase family protein [Dehalococcoidia bacterium]|nr:polysaccharide deacetylase family protein [Dehalococcoidia bacterium]
MNERTRKQFRRVGLTRTGVASARVGLQRLLLSARGRGPGAARPRVLCYHSVGTRQWGINDVSPRRFRHQLETALALGYEFVPPAVVAGGDGPPQKALALTFDDGLASVAVHAAPVLRDMGIPWTLFVVTDWASGRVPGGLDAGLFLDWRMIEQLMGMGMSVGSHSVTHSRLSGLSTDALADELGCSRLAIETHLGVTPEEFAFPVGRRADWHPDAAEAARLAGYRFVYAACEHRRPPGTLPRTMVTSWDGDRLFRAALDGRFDDWEEWLW